ncbi:RVP_2 domain-containing protein [Cephalotus follicularis]|uniref:RVP_2 domain-containing protein n=1 Tax=Cephalotus follicularis TaxID=3775 RepID=A0A1Q3CR81_CEPFO|nr:RVP_2 domain-containing protein [Cephalotus follicularis]
MDSGASHSFISARFASCLDVAPNCMSYILNVSTPTGASMYTDSVHRGYEMSMAGISLYADLIVLPIRDFDVILGMDWLSAHRARMDCYNKTVDFYLPDGTTFQFKGGKGFSTPIISFIRASRYLEKGCEGYLAYVINRRNMEFLWCVNFWMYFLMTWDLCHRRGIWNLLSILYQVQLLFLKHHIEWLLQN